MKQPPVAFRIYGDTFTATGIAAAGRLVAASPAIAFMAGWTSPQVDDYCKRRGWTWKRIRREHAFAKPETVEA